MLLLHDVIKYGEEFLPTHWPDFASKVRRRLDVLVLDDKLYFRKDPLGCSNASQGRRNERKLVIMQTSRSWKAIEDLTSSSSRAAIILSKSVVEENPIESNEELSLQ